MLLAKKVHIFRHLSEEQTKRVVESSLEEDNRLSCLMRFDTKKYAKGDTVPLQAFISFHFIPFHVIESELEKS